MINEGRVLRADLHLHSYHSGHAGHLTFLRARDCYSAPEAVYAAAKARRMDLVTITDHECCVPDVDLKVHNELAEAIVRQWSASSPRPLTAIGGSVECSR